MKYEIVKLSDGKEYKCTFTLASMIEIEKKYGSLDKWEKDVRDGNIESFPWIAYLGLKRFNSQITEEYIANNIYIGDMKKIYEDIFKAFNLSLGNKTNSASNGAKYHNNNSKKK